MNADLSVFRPLSISRSPSFLLLINADLSALFQLFFSPSELIIALSSPTCHSLTFQPHFSLLSMDAFLFTSKTRLISPSFRLVFTLSSQTCTSIPRLHSASSNIRKYIVYFSLLKSRWLPFASGCCFFFLVFYFPPPIFFFSELGILNPFIDKREGSLMTLEIRDVND